jgi:hypothetical protein
VTLLLAGCGSDSGGGSSGDIPTLVAEEIVRMGSVDDPATEFRVLEIGPDGRVYTLHSQGAEVRIHGLDGSSLGSFGGVGEGPGEFMAPWNLGFRDGEIRVLDRRTNRISYFTLDGEFVRDARYTAVLSGDPPERGPTPAGMLVDGTLYGEASVRAEAVVTGEVTHSAMVRFRLDGEVLDTIAVRAFGNGSYSYRFEDGGLYGTQPYSDATIITVSQHQMEAVEADRTVLPGRATFTLTKRAATGDTLWSREYPFEPVPLDPTVIDSVIQRIADDVAEHIPPSRREIEAGIAETLFMPDHMPAFRTLLLGRDGSIWLHRHDAVQDSNRWLVLTAQGDVFGEVRLPHRLRVLNASLSDVWGQFNDDLDVPYIVGYRISSAEP